MNTKNKLDCYEKTWNSYYDKFNEKMCEKKCKKEFSEQWIIYYKRKQNQLILKGCHVRYIKDI